MGKGARVAGVEPSGAGFLLDESRKRSLFCMKGYEDPSLSLVFGSRVLCKGLPCFLAGSCGTFFSLAKGEDDML